MQIKQKYEEAKKNLVTIKKDHTDKIQVEENVLINAKMDLPTLDYLKMEADIEAKRAVRLFSIRRLEEVVKKLESDLNSYMNDLLAKTTAMRKVRDEKFEEDYISKFVSSFLKYKNKGNNYRYMVEAANKKIMPVHNIHNQYSHYLCRYRNGKRNYNPSEFTRPLQRYYYAQQIGGSAYQPYKLQYPTGCYRRHQNDNFYEYFGYPLSSAFKLFNSARKKQYISKIKKLRAHKPGDDLKVEDIINHYSRTFSPLIANWELQNKNLQGLLGAGLTVYDLVDYFYPSAKDYLANPELYPHAIGFMEETPFPNKKQLNDAFRNLAGVGTIEWGERQIEHLKEITEYNTRDIPAGSPYYMWTRKSLALPTGYYKDGKKVEIPYRNMAPFEEIDPNMDPAIKYYAPRPKEGHLYVPEFDYINPLEYVPYREREKSVYTAQGEYLAAVHEAKRLQAREAKRQKFARFRAGMRAALGGGFVGLIFNPGALVAELACFQYGYDSSQCQFMNDYAAVARTGVQAWVTSAVGYITGGTGAAIAGAVTTVASDPNLGLSDNDLGRVIIALAEAYAIATVTDAAIDKALQEVLEQQVYQITKREIGKATGLDKTLLGRVGLDLSAGTAFGLYKDKQFMEALTGSADKSWRLAVARENPYGAILMAGVTEIEKNGWSINSTNPMDWFESIDIGDEFKRVRHSIRGKDLAKLIGLTYMVQAGRISEGDAMLMIGQEASKRNLEKFYHDKPIKEDPEMAAYRKKQAEVNRWKQGIAVMKKLSTGVPPTKEDIMVISDNVATPIYDRIQSLGLPTKYEVNLWNIAIKEVGLPNVAVATPDMSFDLPDWMKSKQSDGHVVITNKEHMEEYLGKKFTKDTELTKEDLVKIILGMFPRNVPLVPVSEYPQVPTFNYIDELGNLKIRDPLKFPFDHPMLRVGHVPKKYTKKQQEYMKAREQEMLIAKAQMAKLTKQLEELQSKSSIG